MNMRDYFDKRVEEACKAAGHKRVRVLYSAYKTDKNDEPLDNLDKVAIKGKVVLVADRDTFWGGSKSKSYVSEPLENPTWLQLTVCANAMIRHTRDTHHVFFEGVVKSSDKHLRELASHLKDVKFYEFCMGS